MSSDDSPHSSVGSLLHDAKTTYSTHRDAFIDSTPFGQTVWDGIRIAFWVVAALSIAWALTGLTTPIVSVTSGSMEPNINTSDAIIIVNHNPSAPPLLATGDGIVTTQSPEPYSSFGGAGTVIVFETPDSEIPVMHRARMRVDEGENWIVRVNSEFAYRDVSCDEVTTCPAKTDGYITAGDNNQRYDQLTGTPVVEESQVHGIVRYRVPYWRVIRNTIELISYNDYRVAELTP